MGTSTVRGPESGVRGPRLVADVDKVARPSPFHRLRTPDAGRRTFGRRGPALIGILAALGANLGVALLLAELTPVPATAKVLPPLPEAMDLPVEEPPKPEPPTTEVEPVKQPVATASALPALPALPPLDLAPSGPGPALPIALTLYRSSPTLPALLLPGLPIGTSQAPAKVAAVPDSPATLVGSLDLERFYPRAARTRRLTGSSRIELDVDPSGQIQQVRCLDSEPPGVFDEAAIRLGRSLRCNPATRAGRPIATTITQHIEWRLRP